MYNGSNNVVVTEAVKLSGNMTAEEKILEAAIECIDKYGPDGATIRRIAEIAGVNSAAISYYFRSKDKLLEKAMDLSLANGFDWSDYPWVDGMPLQEYLTSIFERLVEGSFAYPGITRAHFFNVFSKGEYDSPSVKKINQFFEELTASIMKKYPDRNEAGLRKTLVQMSAAAFLVPSLMPGLFDDFCHIEFKNKSELKSYISHIVVSLLDS